MTSILLTSLTSELTGWPLAATICVGIAAVCIMVCTIHTDRWTWDRE